MPSTHRIPKNEVSLLSSFSWGKHPESELKRYTQIVKLWKSEKLVCTVYKKLHLPLVFTLVFIKCDTDNVVYRPWNRYILAEIWHVCLSAITPPIFVNVEMLFVDLLFVYFSFYTTQIKWFSLNIYITHTHSVGMTFYYKVHNQLNAAHYH